MRVNTKAAQQIRVALSRIMRMRCSHHTNMRCIESCYSNSECVQQRGGSYGVEPRAAGHSQAFVQAVARCLRSPEVKCPLERTLVAADATTRWGRGVYSIADLRVTTFAVLVCSAQLDRAVGVQAHEYRTECCGVLSAYKADAAAALQASQTSYKS